MDQAWFKHSYVCTDCDGLYEITIKSNKSPNPECTEDGQFLTLLSVVDATITPNNQQKEEKMEDTVTKDAVIAMWRQELELTYGNQITELKNQLDAANKRIESLQNGLSNSSGQLGKIIDNLTEDYWFNDSTDKEEVLTELCEILDYEPKKEVSFTATLIISGRYDMPLSEANDFDLEELLRDISVDIYNGDVVFDDISLDSVEEM